MHTGPIRVAVVDDDDDIRTLITMNLMLDDRFECVAQAHDGKAAIALLDRDDIDAMVLDMHMPDIAGRHVLHAVRHVRPDLRVVAFSADGYALVQAAREGAAATVLKGGSIDELLGALAQEQIVA